MISAQCDHANDKYGLVTLQFNLFIFILRIKKLKKFYLLYLYWVIKTIILIGYAWLILHVRKYAHQISMFIFILIICFILSVKIIKIWFVIRSLLYIYPHIFPNILFVISKPAIIKPIL